jgi:hypothetical protein
MFALAGCGSGGGGETHALGEKVVVGYSDPSTADGARTTLGVTVLAVRQGSQEDLTRHGFEVDEESQNTIPYYVDVRYENQGEATVTRSIDVSLEDADGNLISSTLIFNYGDQPFPPCEALTEGELAPGETYESCTLVLVPEGVEIATVSFLSDNGPNEEPEFIYWKIGS